MMLVAYELKKTLAELYRDLDREELGYWLAFLKRKQQLEDEISQKRRNRTNGMGRTPRGF